MQKLTVEMRKECGFSLIEILVALLILALVSLGIMALLPGGYSQITSAGRSSTLNHLAQMKLDYLKSLPITHSDLANGFVSNIEWPFGTSEKYTLRWEVEDYTPLANSKSIVVEAGYDIYRTDDTDKPDSEAIDQKKVLYSTMITQ